MASGSEQRQRPDGIARNAAFALATQIATTVFTAGLTIFLVRELGPTDFGIFSLAVGVAGIVVMPADMGISASTGRFLAEHRGLRDLGASILADGLRLKVVVAGIASALLFALAVPIANAYDSSELVWPLRAVSLAVFGQSMVLFWSSAFTSLAKTSLSLQTVLSESAMETSASVVLVLLGGAATGAAWGRAAGFLFGALIGLVLALRLLGAGMLRPPRLRAGRSAQILRYASALLVIDGAFSILSQIDVLLIGAMISTTAAGLFQAPWRLTTVLHYPGLAVAAGVAPRLARHVDHAPDIDAFRSSLRLLLILQFAIVVPVAVWADPITDLLLGSAYAESAEVLRALAPYVFLAGLAPLVSNSVDYLGEARRRIPVAVGALAINLGIDLVLIPEIGIVAGAIGTDCAYLLYVPAHLWICRGLLDLRLSVLIPTFLRGAGAAAAMAGVLFATGTSDLSLAQWLIGAVGGVAVFAGVLVATGELRRADLRLARALIAQTRGG